MHVAPAPRGYRRRVSSFWEADGQGGHRMVFRWDAKADTYEQTEELRDPAGLERYEDFLHSLLDAGEVEMEGSSASGHPILWIWQVTRRDHLAGDFSAGRE